MCRHIAARRAPFPRGGHGEHPAPRAHGAHAESEVDQPHERAAYFRRTNLHASEDASDIHSLVVQVEAEYLAQSGQAPQATGKPVALLDIELTSRDFAILTTKMGYYR